MIIGKFNPTKPAPTSIKGPKIVVKAPKPKPSQPPQSQPQQTTKE